MALQDLKIDLERLEEGQWFKINGMSFRIKGMNKDLTNRFQKIYAKHRNKPALQLKAINEFVFSEMVLDWKDVTELKLQECIVSNVLHKDSEWFEIADINFLLKRSTNELEQEIKDCTNEDAKQRRRVSKTILDWENMKEKDDDKDCIPFSKKKSVELFTDERFRVFYKGLTKLAEDMDNFKEDVSQDEIAFSKENVEKYILSADKNILTNSVIECSNDETSYRDELILEDVETAKK